MSVRVEQRHHRLPGQLPPLSERRHSERPAATLTPWQEVCGILDLTTRNKPEGRSFIRRNRTTIKEFFDARFATVTGKDPDREAKFMDDYTRNPDSGVYNPDLYHKLSPYLDMIRDRLPIEEISGPKFA